MDKPYKIVTRSPTPELIDVKKGDDMMDAAVLTKLNEIASILKGRPTAFYLSYPTDGSLKSIPIGTTTIDFYNGTIIYPDGTRDALPNSLKSTGADYVRCYELSIDKQVTVSSDTTTGLTSSERALRCDVDNQQLRILYIKATEETEVSLWASSEPNSIFKRDGFIRTSEKISTLQSVASTHFTDSIAQNEHESEDITDLPDNRIYIRGVNIQTTQNLHFRLIFWGKDAFENSDLDVDSYIDHVDLDIPTNGFRIWDGAAFHQYYLDISGLGLMYEDIDGTKELHVSLQNLSPVAKAAGSNVQIDILYSPRL